MKSAARGRSISAAELLNVSAHGFWLFLAPLGRELYLPFREFPWFREATIAELCHVEVEHDHILRWPDLDIDLDVARIEQPDHYPLVSQGRPKSARVTKKTPVAANARSRRVTSHRAR
jgi:hypothetical protein